MPQPDFHQELQLQHALTSTAPSRTILMMIAIYLEEAAPQHKSSCRKRRTACHSVETSTLLHCLAFLQQLPLDAELIHLAP